MRTKLLALVAALLAVTACGRQQTPAADGETARNAIGLEKGFPGDSTRYGLACDGCTDSILVFLPYTGGDPDTFDIITANQQGRIYGRPHIGDELAVILNPEDTVEALAVIDLEELKGSWCYMVTPTLRNIDNMSNRMRRRMMADIPDSVRRSWMKPREYTLRLKRDHTALHVRGVPRQTTTDEMSPVEYPQVRHYTEWHLYNGRLILKADTIKGFTKEGDVPVVDTVDIRLLRQDTLVLDYQGQRQSYYRKREP